MTFGQIDIQEMKKNNIFVHVFNMNDKRNV